MISYSDPKIRKLYYRAPEAFRTVMTFVYSWRQRSVRFGREYSDFLALLERSTGLNREQILVDQVDRLKRLLILARDTVPYYQSIFQKYGFDPESLTSVLDLSRLPILEKETIQQRAEDFLNQQYRGSLFKTHTSGTTGRGLHLYLSKVANQRSYACVWFHYGWAKLRRGEPVATFAGHPVADPDRQKPPFWQYDPLENELLFSSQHIKEDTLPFYIKKLCSFQPAAVRGYPSSIYLIALGILEAGNTSICPKAVFSSSETLFDYQRKAIERAFSCRVFSYYGNTERAAHILQCEAGNYHIVPQACVIEVVNPDGTLAAPDVPGEIVCTGLVDDAMPLIRYRIGDTGVWASQLCSCGRNTPILSTIIGRVEDYIITPNGRYVGRLDHAFKDMIHLKEAQIVQEDPGSILVKIVPLGYTAQDENCILQELRLRLGREIQIRFEKVEQIPRLPNGKFRFVISNVPITLRGGLQSWQVLSLDEDKKS